MDAGAGAAIAILAMVAAGVGWLVWRHGWSGAWQRVRSCPAATWSLVSRRVAGGYESVSGGDGVAGSGRRRALTSAAVDQLRFIRCAEPGHRFSFLYPASWALARSDNPHASIIVQVTCDSREESYKRFSVAWDDVSWCDTTAATFGRGVVEQLTSMVPGSELVNHGLYDPGRRTDGAYHIVYTVADPLDPAASRLQVLNVIVVSAHGGRRRAYTVTFGVDADAWNDALRLATHMIDSFVIDGFLADGPASSGGGAGASSSAAPPAPGAAPARHVHIWDRAAAAAGGSGGGAEDGSAAVAVSAPRPEGVLPGETPADPGAIAWSSAVIPQAGIAFRFPAGWVCSGLGHDESQGFAPVALHSVRRWCASYTCDRREHAYKHVSIVAVDITPLLDVVQARLAKAPRALEGTDAGTVLLAYLAFRYRCEVAEHQAAAAGAAYTPPPFASGEEVLRPWAEVFSQCWPPPCRLASPLSLANASRDALAPVQAAVLDSRVMATSRLLKVSGWLRSSGSGPAGNGSTGGGDGGSHPASSPRHHSSTYSSLSLDADNSVAEGWLIHTTGAVLIGVHDAHVVTGAATRPAAGMRSAAAPVRRVFGHLVTVATACDLWPAWEPVAKAVFQGLQARSAGAGTGTG
jgi:hypothetical protein